MPLVIPIFIPHEGCPHACVFCNQHRISGFREKPVTPSDVAATIEQWLAREGSGNRDVQVAFYGGSFTGLKQERQQELLAVVESFITLGRVKAVRLSTRPDYIDEDIADFLENNYVQVVELGVQSMDDVVLSAAGRGHTASNVEQAVRILNAHKVELGIQLMLGLPGQSRKSVIDTVHRVIALRPDFVRIYPVLVVKNSALASQYAKGSFQPISLSLAVIMAAWMKKRFDRAGIRVVRMGLQAGVELEESFIAGPWHPAFGEMVRARLMLHQTRKLLVSSKSIKCILLISPKDQSVFRGMKSANIKRLQALGLADSFILKTDPGQQRQTVQKLPVG